MVPVKIADVFIGILLSVSLQLRVISQPTIDSFEDNSCPQLEEEWRLQTLEIQCLKFELAYEQQSLKTLKNACHNQSEERQGFREELENERESLKTLENISQSQSAENQRLKEELENERESLRTLENVSHSQSEENQRLKEELENERESLKTMENVSHSQSEENQRLKQEVENGKQLVQTLRQQLDEGRVFINFTERLDLENYREVNGVTKLRNEIYVLSRYNSSYSYSPVIRVFEDRNPFRLQKKIYLTEARYPYDMGSSETENCLYVIDRSSENKGIWKITKETDGQYKIIKWLNTTYVPITLSVTSDGRLLVVDRDSPILRIYGSDAQRLHSIQLPRDIGSLRHAVETFIGNFIITYWFDEEKKGDSGSSGRVRKWGISEVTKDGQVVVCRFIPSNETEELNYTAHLSIGSNDRVIVVEEFSRRVILLDFNLGWNRILSPTKAEGGTHMPKRLYYDEEKKQLIVGGFSEVNVYTLNIK